MAGANILQSYLIKLGIQADEAGLKAFVDKAAAGMSRLALLGTAAVAAFAALRTGVIRTARTQAELNDLAERVGTTAESIERMDYVARQLGGGANAARSSMEGLSTVVGAAAAGVPKATKAFGDLGIDIRDGNKNLKDTAELMDEIGRSIKKYDTAEQRFRLMRLGIDPTMIRALTEDTRELESEFNKFAIAAGIDFNKAAKAGGDLTTEMKKTRGFLGDIWTGISTDLMPVVESTYKRLNKYIIDYAEKIGKAVKSIGNGIRIFFVVGERVLLRVAQGVTKVAEAFAFLHDKSDGASTIVLGLAAAVALLGWPIAAVVSGITAAALVIDDLITALEGGKTLFDWSPWLPSIQAAVEWVETLANKFKEELPKYIQAAKDEFWSVFEAIKTWLNEVAQAAGFKDLEQAVMAWGSAIGTVLEALGAVAAYVAGDAWALVKGTFGFIGDAITAVIEILRNLGEFVVNVLQGDFGAAFENIKNIVVSFDEFMQRTFERVKNLVLGVIGTIGDAINAVSEFLGISGDMPTQKKPSYSAQEKSRMRFSATEQMSLLQATPLGASPSVEAAASNAAAITGNAEDNSTFTQTNYINTRDNPAAIAREVGRATEERTRRADGRSRGIIRNLRTATP